jgi:hypothetical protein
MLSATIQNDAQSSFGDALNSEKSQSVSVLSIWKWYRSHVTSDIGTEHIVESKNLKYCKFDHEIIFYLPTSLREKLWPMINK